MICPGLESRDVCVLWEGPAGREELGTAGSSTQLLKQSPLSPLRLFLGLTYTRHRHWVAEREARPTFFFFLISSWVIFICSDIREERERKLILDQLLTTGYNKYLYSLNSSKVCDMICFPNKLPPPNWLMHIADNQISSTAGSWSKSPQAVYSITRQDMSW